MLSRRRNLARAVGTEAILEERIGARWRVTGVGLVEVDMVKAEVERFLVGNIEVMKYIAFTREVAVEVDLFPTRAEEEVVELFAWFHQLKLS